MRVVNSPFGARKRRGKAKPAFQDCAFEATFHCFNDVTHHVSPRFGLQHSEKCFETRLNRWIGRVSALFGLRISETLVRPSEISVSMS